MEYRYSKTKTVVPPSYHHASMTRYCGKCGTMMRNGEYYCRQCGTAMDDYDDQSNYVEVTDYQPVNPQTGGFQPMPIMSYPATIPYTQQELMGLIFALQQYYDIVPKGQAFQPVTPTVQYNSDGAPFYGIPVMPNAATPPPPPAKADTPKSTSKKKTVKPKPVEEESDEDAEEEIDEDEDIEDGMKDEDEDEDVDDNEEEVKAKEAKATPTANKTANKTATSRKTTGKTETVKTEDKKEVAENAEHKPKLRAKVTVIQVPDGHAPQIKQPTQGQMPQHPMPPQQQRTATFGQAQRPMPAQQQRPMPPQQQQRVAGFGQSPQRPMPPQQRAAQQRPNGANNRQRPPQEQQQAQHYELNNTDGYYNDTVPRDGGYQRNNLSRTQIIKMILVAGGMGLALLIVFGVIPAVFG